MTTYLKYIIKNMEPVRIADDSNSQSGQTEILRYIPGTTIRGLVINALSSADETEFEKIKKQLFTSHVRYLNAYLSTYAEELFPSPKGFYEDKTAPDGKKEIQNVVVSGKFTEGYKRASLGRYCFVAEDCIHYYNVDTGSDMKIKMNVNSNEKQNVFRNDYISPNHIFTGYIGSDDKELLEKIRSVFGRDIFLGNGRSSGLGRCRVLKCEYTDVPPYANYFPENDIQDECYLILMSNLVLRSGQGELCGFTGEILRDLEERMGVKNLKIQYCATSVVNVRGYNRKWGMKTPSIPAYEQGSVFHLSFDGKLKKEKMYEIADQGIGIHLNEGFGRVAFFKNYERIRYKISEQYSGRKMCSGKDWKITHDDRETLRIAARSYYRNRIFEKMEKCIVLWTESDSVFDSSLSNSQLGTLESFVLKNRYNPEEAQKTIKKYLAHADEKEEGNNSQKQHGSVKKIRAFIDKVFNTDLEELLGLSDDFSDTVMGIPKEELLSENERMEMKLGLLDKMIRYKNKGER